MAAWAAQPALAEAIRAPGGVYLVLDGRDGAVLRHAPAAGALVQALGPAGAADLARQAAAVAGEGPARLARLRLDARRIAPPTLCLLARGTRVDGGPVVILVPAGPANLPRPRAVRQVPEADPAPAVPAIQAPGDPDEMPRPGDRFLWRSDAGGTLTALTGAGALARLVGAPWSGHAATGRLSGGAGLLAALAGRETFRAVPAIIDLGGVPVSVELSGAPLTRGEAAFAGFGLVRTVAAPADDAPAAPEAEAGPQAGGADPGADEPAGTAGGAEPPAQPAHPRDPMPAGEPSLSITEHAAFREIARALGARYAGDDDPDGRTGPARAAGGAVMPFRGVQADLPAEAGGQASPRREGGTLLDGLPVPVLVLRGAAILAANRLLLALAGFPDIEALRASGIGRLFRGLPPEAAASAGEARRTAIEAGDGRTRPVEVASGACTWGGEPAACLVLRPLAEDDAVQAVVAERLARQVQAARAFSAEAALDALEAGVVTIDGEGRVSALNRAAAAMLGGDPREIVGGRFADLFEAEGGAGVAAALRGAGAGPRAVVVGGRAATLALAPPRADGSRVAVLQGPAPLPPPEPAAPARERPAAAHGAFLARIDRDLRRPMTEVVAMTGAMLDEPYGPLGDPRYRRCLDDIRAAGGRILERLTELRDLAAVEAGAIDLVPRPIALNELVAGCVERLQPDAARGRILLRTSFSPDLAELEADEPSMSRAAALVIEHAIRRAPAGGQVIVSTGSTDSEAVALRVRDTGAGPAAPAPDEAAPEDRLALPRALVEANGGRLHLTGRAEVGTLVEIILPARRAARA